MTKSGIVRSSPTLDSRAKHPSMPFRKHDKEVGWQIQTWQGQP